MAKDTDETLSFPWPVNQEPSTYSERLHGIADSTKKVVHYAFNDDDDDDEQPPKQLTTYDRAAQFLPALRWLRGYDIRKWLVWDLIAGLSVGAMVVPQGMSYAVIAGLPFVYGLYGAFMPCIIYALFGSSRQLAVGPVAVTSLLIGNGMVKDVLPAAANITNPNKLLPEQVDLQNEYNTKVIQLAFIVACLYTASGLLGLGFIITRFLSHPTIAGFTSGASVIIGLSQVKYILGVSVSRKDAVHEQISDLIAQGGNVKWQEVVMGLTIMALLIAFKLLGKVKNNKYAKAIAPMGPLIACIIGIAAVAIGGLDKRGIKIVATIPKGLPPLSITKWFPMTDFGSLFKLAVIVMLVDLLESTSIARALAMKHGYRLNFTQEIVGLGLANFAGAMFSAYTTTGSFSRSAVNSSSGAKTPVACFTTAWVVGLVLLFLTPVFEKIPYNVLAGVIIVGVSGLFEWQYALQLFRVRLWDFTVFMVGFICVMFLGVELGLAASIGVSLLTVVLEAAFPHVAMLGQVEKTSTYRNLKQYSEARVIPGLLVVRVGAPLYFANVQWVEDKLNAFAKRAAKYSREAGTELRYIIFDLSPVNHVDTQGVTLLEELAEQFGARGIQLVLTNPAPRVVRTWEDAGLFNKLSRRWVFARVHDAVTTCRGLLAEADAQKAEAGDSVKL